MSNGINRVVLFGNLGSDPELRMTNGGQPVLNMRLATTETYLDRNKVRQEQTEWHNVVLWGKRAEALAKILSKGSRVLIEGAIRTTNYEPKDRPGEKRYRTDIVARNVVLAGGGSRSRPEDKPYADPEPPTYGDDDEIPF